MKSEKAQKFLETHGMAPERSDPGVLAEAICRDMRAGLDGESSDIPMFPAYLNCEGSIAAGSRAIVIDAGGTNFRRAVICFDENGWTAEKLEKSEMPGKAAPIEWDELISVTADRIMPIIEEADVIGFCFSYNASVTPDIDCCVVTMDKEVVVRGCQGKLVGASLQAELERRGVHGKKIVVLNDTVAVLLGGAAKLDQSAYDGFIGQVSGTGTNLSCAVEKSMIHKLSLKSDGTMIINCEAGKFNALPRGDFDIELDGNTAIPNTSALEKMTAGGYLGELARMMIRTAAQEGVISTRTGEAVAAIGKFNSGLIDAWDRGEQLEYAANEDDAQFLSAISHALFERSARIMCSALTGIMLLTDKGGSAEKPVCVCAEGSLVQKSHSYLPMLRSFLEQYAVGVHGRHAEVVLGDESTFSGSAAAAILNT